MPIETANPEMAAAWDGQEGAGWAKHADHYDTGTARYNAHLIEGASISPTDRILRHRMRQRLLDAGRSEDGLLR